MNTKGKNENVGLEDILAVFLGFVGCELIISCSLVYELKVGYQEV